MTLNYNDTFSKHNPKYRKAFNDILYNPKTSNYLKVSLKQMDNSRNAILSKIISFTDEYASFSQSIQKFNDQAIILNSNSIFNDNNFYNVGSKSYYSFVSYHGSIIMGILIMIVSVLYLDIFFIKKHFADVFLCLFPLFAAGLITGGTLTGVYLKYDDYFNIYYDCEKLHSRSFNAKKKNLTNFGIVGKRIDFFHNNNESEIKILFESINAKTVHKNYFDIYTQYSKNIDFKDSLDEIYSTIKQSKKQLRQMKKLLNEISGFGFSIYQNISYLHNLSNEIIYELSNYDEKIPSNCISIIKGSNCFINGSLVLFLGLVVMFFSIFIRRTKPNDYKVENGQRGQGNYDFEAGKKHVWLFAYSYWHKSTIVRDGEYGKGIYFYYDYKEALRQFMNFVHETPSTLKSKYDKIISVYCEVDFGRALHIDWWGLDFKLPDTLNEYNCQSVISEKGDMVVYDSERINVLEVKAVDIEVFDNL